MDENKENKTCGICHKKTERSCAHIKCPNRKPVTAKVADGNDGLINSGTFRKTPTLKGDYS